MVTDKKTVVDWVDESLGYIKEALRVGQHPKNYQLEVIEKTLEAVKEVVKTSKAGKEVV